MIRDFKNKTREQLIQALEELQKENNSLKAFIEIGPAVKNKEDSVLRKLILAAEEFIRFTNGTPDYHRILEFILDISGARYAALNVFDENGLDFTTVAINGVQENIVKAIHFLGFDIQHKHWDYDPHRAEKTKGQIITRFLHLHELTGSVIPKSAVFLIEKTFGIDEAFIVKIVKENKVLGDFTLLFEKGKTLTNNSFVELYANLAGMFFDRNRLITSLQQSESRHSSMISNISDVIGIIGADGRVKYLSPNSQKWFGWLPQDITGTESMATVHPDDVADMQQAFLSILETERAAKTVEYRSKCKDGSYKPIHLTAANLINDPIINGILVNFHDITARKQAEQELKENEKRLHQLNADKNLFLSVLSHDLRSPFNTLLGLSTLLLEDVQKLDNCEIESIANNLNKAAQNSYNLLEDILMWARAQEGKIPFMPQNLRFEDACKNTIEVLMAGAEAKNVSINLVNTGQITVFADIDMLKTVLRNLVSNSIKFTNSGGTINIQAIENADYVTITVSDSGVGISPDVLSKLFNISQVYTTKGTAQETGTGLGLYLCKEFIEKHGGKIRVESVPGKGSDFIFTLPVVASQAKDRPPD